MESEEAAVSDDTQITFNIKSSSDAKYVVTVPQSMTVADLKSKLSTTEYADVPAERQRLIHSGRVLKDPDTLSMYKIKDGNTVHLVKAAVSSQRQSTTGQGSTTAAVAGASAGVPQNLAAGTGNDPLAGLTGARYAGFAQMPGAGMFGPDGGMGPPPDPEEMLRQLENPMFAQQMNEAMNNPAVIQMIQNNPAFRDQPHLRQMLQDPEFRRMMMDPQMIRSSMQMARMMGGTAAGGGGGMPAPGVTDTTPQEGAATGGAASPTQTSTNPHQLLPPNPFMFLGHGPQGQPNPFAALFGGTNPQQTANTNTTSSNDTTDSTNNNTQTYPNPLANMLAGAMANQAGQQNNPMGNMMQQMMQNPRMIEYARQMMMGMGGDAASGAGSFNPFALLGGAGGMGAPPPPQDTRPPEEQYAEQLRQLNDMGFFEFERNIRALRRAGGNVQGAVEALLSDI